MFGNVCTLIEVLISHQWVAISILAAVAFLIYSTYPFVYFYRHGIPGPTPLPIVGNLLSLARMSVPEHDAKVLNQYGPIAGTYFGRFPVLLLSDPDIIKQILVKESHIFTNREPFFQLDNLSSYFLTVLKDDHWKHIRALMTPAFTGGKLKQMISDINITAKNLGDNFQALLDSGDTVFEAKKMFGHFTMDVIATTAFGLQVDSLKNNDDPFIAEARKVFDLNLLSPKFLIGFLFPEISFLLTKLHLKKGIISDSALQFFSSIVERTLADRRDQMQKANNEALWSSSRQRVDFIELMARAHVSDEQMRSDVASGSAQVQCGANGPWHAKGATTNEILAQGSLFLAAGYETTANTLAFAAYLLALNPECQRKCADEIRQVIGHCATTNQPTYEQLNSLIYMEQCILETLRIFPPASRLNRFCKQDVVINGVPFPKGAVVNISVYHLHHNGAHYWQPQNFDPDRFEGERKTEILNSYTYLPFGAGPRVCIGMRLALLEIKAALCHLLQRFTFAPCKTTEIPLVMDKLPLLRAKNGVYLRVQAR